MDLATPDHQLVGNLEACSQWLVVAIWQRNNLATHKYLHLHPSEQVNIYWWWIMWNSSSRQMLKKISSSYYEANLFLNELPPTILILEMETKKAIIIPGILNLLEPLFQTFSVLILILILNLSLVSISTFLIDQALCFFDIPKQTSKILFFI